MADLSRKISFSSKSDIYTSIPTKVVFWSIFQEIVSDHKKNTDKFYDLVSAYIEEMKARSNKTSSFSGK
jgi:hypothetical protein